MRPWFLAIVANQCRELRRGHWRRLITQPAILERRDPAEDDLINRVHIRRALERLKREERIVVVLHYYVGLPWSEVAEIAGVSEAGARARLYRALAKIRPLDRAAVTP